MFLLLFPQAWGQSVGVVLSGGGAKGVSHIGVLKALEENNIPVDYICGTSMGAVVASFYAMGLSPDEMMDIIKSREFEAWYNGRQEEGTASWFYREEATPRMFSISLKRRGGKVVPAFPSSIVSPYPMDLAMMEAYASPSAAAGHDFSNLMVPFFCISSDIKNKRKIVHVEGDLGSAVRASMTYPFIFKPITIDSTVLFDGGFYDNFPWNELLRLHSPDFIIGSKCVVGDAPLDDENIVGQITNMIVSRTDYDIPQEKGIVISRKYPYGVMEFGKAEEIMESGYGAALERIPEIEGRVSRRRSAWELDSMRLAFRRRMPKVVFSPQIMFEGSLNGRQQDFVSGTITGKEEKPFDFSTLKRGYYRVAATRTLNTFHPSCVPDGDSLMTLKIRASAASPMEIAAGGNISSADLNQGYLQVTWTHLGKTPWRMQLHGNLGTFYSGTGLYWRHNAGISPLFYYDIGVLAQRFKYESHKAVHREYGVRIGAATPLDMRGNLLLKGEVAAGKGTVETPSHNTGLIVLSPSVQLQKNTLNYPLYPTEGMRLHFGLRWNRVEEQELERVHSGFRLRVLADLYMRMGKHFRLGVNADLLWQRPLEMEGYLPALLLKPAFHPFPYPRAMLLEGYRADTYAGIGISPVICVAKTLFLHGNVSYFQPYRLIYGDQEGGYGCGERFPKGAFLGNMALVWHSPIGPVSFSASWYQKGERHKWYPQMNVGFLLFKKKMLED